MVLRTADLAVGVERALIDVEPSPQHTVEDLAELESRAESAVGGGHDTTLLVMYLVCLDLAEHPSQAAAPRPVWPSRCGAWHAPWR
jgi:hypothetical protein